MAGESRPGAADRRGVGREGIRAQDTYRGTCEQFGIVRRDVPKSEGCQARSSRTTGPSSENDSVTARVTLVRRDFVLVLHRISAITQLSLLR